MTADPQIVELYRRGCDPETIAKALDRPLDYVRHVLYEDVPSFRAAVAEVPAGTPLHEEMLQIIAGVARGSSSEFARLAAARYVRDDQLGRLDKVVAAPVGDQHVLASINERLDTLEAAKAKFRRPAAQEVIVDAQVVVNAGA